MRNVLLLIAPLTLATLLPQVPTAASRAAEEPAPTRKFEVKDDRPFLGGKQIDLWGLRCGNAL